MGKRETGEENCIEEKRAGQCEFVVPDRFSFLLTMN